VDINREPPAAEVTLLRPARRDYGGQARTVTSNGVDVVDGLHSNLVTTRPLLLPHCDPVHWSLGEEGSNL